LEEAKVGLPVEDSLNSVSEERAVGLNPWSPHRAPLGAVEHPIVNRRSVCSAPYQAIKGVHLSDEVAFSKAADRRVAAHRANSC